MLLSNLPTRIVCIAAVFSLFTGCSLSSSSPTSATNMQQGPVVAITATQRPSSVQAEGFLKGEVLNASQVVILSCATSPISATFSATGSASGPFPGTFTETGRWSDESDGYGRYNYFRAQFRISSKKSHLIKGKIFGRVHGISCHSADKIIDIGYRVYHQPLGSASMRRITANGLRQTFY
jgi:hypothetical protein